MAVAPLQDATPFQTQPFAAYHQRTPVQEAEAARHTAAFEQHCFVGIYWAGLWVSTGLFCEYLLR
jgi:hypothetical protein